MKLSKKVRNSILLTLGFLLSWFLYLLIIGGIILFTSDKDKIFTPMIEYLGIGIIYLLIVIVVTIICSHSKGIDEIYKNVICFFPLFILIFFFPMMCLTIYIQTFLRELFGI